MHQVLRRENIIQLRRRQQSALQHHFSYALAGFGTDLADDIAIVVADKRVEVGDDADGVIHVAFTYRFIGGDAVNAFLQQVVAGVGQDMNRLEHRLADHRLHHVQLQLTGFGGHGHSGIVADNFEADR